MAISFILIKIISPERCSSLVFSINYKWQILFIANQFVSVMKIFRKPVLVSASAFSIIKNPRSYNLFLFSVRQVFLVSYYVRNESIPHRKCKMECIFSIN
ncbi:hypothetical protein Tsp_03020 [Trichinella spiralis]|uniref:hypothetical protein n=1 Tax=Trichinella spiralis TaxID=6334 RepID=UPI0001EFB3F6|nr:hypothetical protein Tsp_03020 [Trichinella spiralis]